MLDAILKNQTLMSGVLGGLIRSIPPAVWQQLSQQLERGIAEVQALRATLDRIEAKLADHGERVDFLETLCRDYIPDAGVVFAERDMYRGDTRTHIGGVAVADIRRGEPDIHTGGPR